MPKLHCSEGKLKFDKSVPKLYVEVDPGVAELTRSLLPKSLRFNIPRYAPHITIARNELIPEAIKLFDGHAIHFEYNPEPVVGDVYVWLRVYCNELKNLRKVLGMEPTSELSRPPDGEDCFHITVANFK